MFSGLMKKSKSVSSRKFLCTDNNAYVQWQVDNDGDCRMIIHDGRETVFFSEWLSHGDNFEKDSLALDKKMGILVDEINAMRKAVKSKKK